jgi:hypothetical protein
MDGGAAIDAAPNIRSAFEYSLAVVWLWREKASGVVDSLALRWIMDGLQGMRTGSTAQVPGVEGLLKVIVELQSENELPSGDIAVTPYRFIWLTGRLGVADPANLNYAFLSAFCHPTLAALLGFLRFGSDATQASIDPVRPVHPGNPLLWAVQCQCWAGLALDRILEDGLPFRDRLNAIAEAIELPMQAQLFPPEDLS